MDRMSINAGVSKLRPKVFSYRNVLDNGSGCMPQNSASVKPPGLPPVQHRIVLEEMCDRSTYHRYANHSS